MRWLRAIQRGDHKFARAGRRAPCSIKALRGCTAAHSEERSKQLEKGNLELAVERERSARARIESGLASRHVRPEQKATLIDALKGVKLAVVISRYDDAE